MGEQRVGWTFLYSKRWLGYFALLLIFAVACVYLGNWQFDRRAAARAEIARIDRNYDATPVPLTDALADPAGFNVDQHKWLSVTLQGSYEGEAVLARNRPGPEGVGADILQPFRTVDGKLFIVDRGWVLAGGSELDEVAAAVPQAPRGTVDVVVRLRPSEPEVSGRSSAGRTVASINIEEIVDLTGVAGEVYSGTYGMLVSEHPAAEHGILPPRPERDEGPHLSYALQWYVFILIGAIGVAYAARQEYKNLNAGSKEVRDIEAKSRERQRRRGPSDADEEDALIDA